MLGFILRSYLFLKLFSIVACFTYGFAYLSSLTKVTVSLKTRRMSLRVTISSPYQDCIYFSTILLLLLALFFPLSFYLVPCRARQFRETSPNDERRQVPKEHDRIFTESSLNGTQVD